MERQIRLLIFFQKKGVNRINTVKSSKRPINIKNEDQYLPKDGNSLKLLAGPKFPIAGPTFPSDEAATPTAFLKSNPIKPKTKLPMIKEIIYSMKKPKILPIISLLTTLPL